MLVRKSEHRRSGGTLARQIAGEPAGGTDRRTFLIKSGLAGGALAALGSLPLGAIRKAEAGPPAPAGATVTTHKNVCTHCSVGCSVIGKVANGV
jgi:formate dehydrogenase major subunit